MAKSKLTLKQIIEEKSVGWIVAQVFLWLFFWPIMLILLACGLYWKWGY